MRRVPIPVGPVDVPQVVVEQARRARRRVGGLRQRRVEQRGLHKRLVGHVGAFQVPSQLPNAAGGGEVLAGGTAEDDPLGSVEEPGVARRLRPADGQRHGRIQNRPRTGEAAARRAVPKQGCWSGIEEKEALAAAFEPGGGAHGGVRGVPHRVGRREFGRHKRDALPAAEEARELPLGAQGDVRVRQVNEKVEVGRRGERDHQRL
mmetsp:Transcript_17060/g.55577  ORF Transcript_17060/g.55577 Transcript_17060/m.55577 type:complete len:205 (+) Transcript_17060:599-1213(+)